MGLPITFTKILTAANSTVIATSQARGSAGAFTLSSGPPVLLNSQRRVQLVATASNSGALLVIAGTNDGGLAIGETITVSATATTLVSQMDYKTITAISSNQTLTGNVIIGTNSTGSSPWQVPNYWLNPSNICVGITSTGSGVVTFSAEFTMDLDPCGIQSNAPLTASNAYVSSQHNGLTTSAVALLSAGDATSQFPIPCSAWRLTVTAGTGGCQVSAIQAGGGVQ